MITFSVFGRKHSGKTTVCQELIDVLSKKGTVGYEKRTHTTIKLDQHLQMAHQTLWSVVRDSENLQLITTKAPVNLPPVDFLVVEGYIPDVPNILCVKDQYDLEAITPFTLAAVSLSGIPNTKRPDELKNVINSYLERQKEE